MGLTGKLSVIAVCALIVCGAIQPLSATADDGANMAVTPEEGAAGLNTEPSVDALANRIDQLVAAYDQPTRSFDSSKVSNDVLGSPEGRAFIDAVDLASSGSSSAEIDTALVALRSQAFPAQASLSPGYQVLVTGGSDPWPYVQLTKAEQQAMVTGGSAALVAAICALLGPETAGVGCGVGAAVIAMIVGIIVANGVCANNRQMRIYPLAGPTGFSCQ